MKLVSEILKNEFSGAAIELYGIPLPTEWLWEPDGFLIAVAFAGLKKRPFSEAFKRSEYAPHRLILYAFEGEVEVDLSAIRAALGQERPIKMDQFVRCFYWAAYDAGDLDAKVEWALLISRIVYKLSKLIPRDRRRQLRRSGES